MYQIGFGQVASAPFAGPGHWNDPDMLVLGWVGWGPNRHQTLLTPDQQYTHVSMWALLAAPLLLGNDLTRLDDFTLNLICNDEVLEIDQDKLDKQAVPILRQQDFEIWKRDLSDGAFALGIFNVSGHTLNLDIPLSELGFKEAVSLRDV